MVDAKVLRWARVFQPLIPVEDDLRIKWMNLNRYGDGDWGNGRGDGVGEGNHVEYQPFKGKGCGQYGWRDGDGVCRRS